jgi:hypothetical protein
MGKTLTIKKEPSDGSSAVRILRNVPYENGFHFFNSPKHYTGITVISLREFVDKLKTVDTACVSFHFQRHDFQKWIAGTIGDSDLAMQINQINIDLSQEKLRNEILETVQNRIAALQKLADVRRGFVKRNSG